VAVARTHRPIWNKSLCMVCGTCTRHCPTTIFAEQRSELDSLRGRVARSGSFPKGQKTLPVPACQAACPLGQDVPAYLRAIAASDFNEALRVILDSNPFPSVCGRLCLRACMRACVRGVLDRPLEIRALKQAAAKIGQKQERKTNNRESSGKVAVIGAGPAGLSAAYFLNRKGAQVTVYEAEQKAGGLLRVAVPSFDLDPQALDQDLSFLLAEGVSIQTGWSLRSANDLDRLFSEGAKAVILATGAGRGKRLGIEGENLKGCFDALSFSKMYHDGKGSPLKGAVVVAGSGNMAVAVARMAVRSGASSVTVLLNRSIRESPVDTDALRHAGEEGIVFVESVRPTALVGKKAVTGVKVLPVEYGSPDRVGRRWPKTSEENAPGLHESELEASIFIAADDRESDFGWLKEGDGISIGPVGGIRVDSELMTDRRGVFAAGEVTTGPRNCIESIAMGRKAAEEVDRFLLGAKQ
jgi:NADPH-dependent glutamate synthase beta subunit-like oxidoreductase